MESAFTLSRALCAAHQRSHCVLVGSATIGLTLTLRAFGVEGRPVAVPNGVCLNVPLAVIFAGGIPKYCDIDPVTLGLSVDSLQRCIPAPAAVVAVHSYGAVCDIEGIANYCRSSAAFLIEDLAVAQGATIRGQPVGVIGDCAVLSFGSGKIIDVGGEGAVLTNDRSLADTVGKLHAELRLRKEGDKRKLEAFDRYHTSLYNKHYGSDLEAHAPGFLGMAAGLRSAFLSRPRCNYEEVAQKIRGLADNIRRRERFAEKLYNTFCGPYDHVVPYHPPEGSVYWRFNLFLRSGRDRVLKTLLAERFLVSSWYPSADLFLGGRKVSRTTTPVSDQVGDEILNIWVNDQVDYKYVERISERIKSLIS